MDLYEYQGKQYFARFGIPTSPGGVAEVFTPGASLEGIASWLEEALDARDTG